MTKIRVLVVEDSLTVRRYLVDLLRGRADFEVVGEAEDGKQAIELCQCLRPDVLTLDMMMPVMSGLAATEYIMAFSPTPILVVSGSMNRGEVFRTYEALDAGAVDVLEKPGEDGVDGDWERQFIEKLKLVSRVKVITHPRARLRSISRAPARTSGPSPAERPAPYRCVGIGASTGGPQTVAALLRDLPADFPLPILLVIHLSSGFGESFASWLNDQASFPVTAAVDGERLPDCGSPRAILARPDRHLVLREGRLWLTRGAEVHSCRPSVDVLFESLAHELEESAVGVVLTGMGRDGARGLLAMRNAGSMTFAQDEATSVIFGMPREAIAIGAAEKVLSLDEMGPALTALACTGRAREAFT